MSRDYLAILAQTTGTYRIEKLSGVDYIVVPVVALVEGVIQGVTAEQPELALASEFGRFPPSWNGRPVTIDHPNVPNPDNPSGAPIRVSANTDPDILENFQVGFIFNTKLTDQSKLSMEIWLDPVRMANHSEAAKKLLAKIKTGEKVEVSTGLFTQSDSQEGTYQGEHYYSVWRGVVPDHLALLPDGLVGACSIEDGCGVHAHAQAQAKPPLQFRVQNCNCEPNGILSRSQPQPKQNNLQFDPRQFLANLMPDGMLDMDVRSILQDALDDEYPGAYAYLIGFTNDKLVYSAYDSMSNERSTVQCSYSIDGTSKEATLADDEEEVTLTTTITPAPADSGGNGSSAFMSSKETKMTTPTPTLTSPATATSAPTPATGSAAPAAPAVSTPTTPASTPQTSSTQPQPVVASSASPAATPASAAAPSAPETRAGVASSSSPQKPMTVEEYLAAAPQGIRESLESGMRMHENHKMGLITRLTALTNRCKFTPEQLRSMDVQMLENLVELAAVPNYGGQATGDSMRAHSTLKQDDGDSAFAPPPPRLDIAPASTTPSKAA